MNRLALVSCLWWLCAACVGTAEAVALTSVQGESSVPIYVIGQGWHVGLAFRTSDIPLGLVPERADFSGADYLEVGWGDRDYYRSADPDFWVTLKAGLWPTASVLHVVGVRGTITDHFADFEVLRLDVTRSGLVGLVTFIHNSFARGGAAKAAPLESGWGRDSLFYPARGTFHVFNTCNTWTARTLEAAGYPMGRPSTADQLMTKVRSFAVLEAPNAAVPRE